MINQKRSKDKLPSGLQPKDWCSVNFGNAGKIIYGRVTKVIFSEFSVFYDIEVPIAKDPVDRQVINDGIENAEGWTRIHGVASAFVEVLEAV